ncbi:MAG: ABC transporter substrate-binding protein [Emcibacteraceae bacterium]|nr:ABC transporter substrate-binding protein [Emcibacteraceae bacterium]
MIKVGSRIIVFMALFYMPVSIIAAVDTPGKHAYAPYSTPKYPANFKHYQSANPDAPKAGTLRLSAKGTFDTLNPWIVNGRYASGVYDWLYDSLLSESPDEQQVGYALIAQSIEVSKDGREAIFHINPMARFHDGEPILSDDVIFSADVFRDKARPGWRILLKEAEVTEIDAHTVQVKFPKTANREAVYQFGVIPILPKHYWQERDFGKTTLDIPVGSGPYRIAEIKSGRQITFERVRDYWAQSLPVRVGIANFDRIIYNHFFDETTRLTAFMKGDIDLYKITEQQWGEASNKPTVQSGKIALLRVDAWWPMGMNGFFFNMRNDLFSDVHVRKALNMVVPFNWVNEHLMHGAYTRTRSYFENASFSAVFPPNSRERSEMSAFPNHFDELSLKTAFTPYDVNLSEGAREQLIAATNMLKQAGWEIDPKTGYQRHKTSGKLLEFTILAFSDSQEKLYGAWAQQLEKIGVRSKLQIVDSSAFEKRIKESDFDAAYRFYIPSPRPGQEQVRLWGSVKMNPEKEGGNTFGINSPAVDHFLKLLQVAKTDDDKAFALRLLDRALQNGHYAVPSYQDRQWRYAYWSERLVPASKPPEYGSGMEFLWCKE